MNAAAAEVDSTTTRIDWWKETYERRPTTVEQQITILLRGTYSSSSSLSLPSVSSSAKRKRVSQRLEYHLLLPQSCEWIYCCYWMVDCQMEVCLNGIIKISLGVVVSQLSCPFIPRLLHGTSFNVAGEAATDCAGSLYLGPLFTDWMTGGGGGGVIKHPNCAPLVNPIAVQEQNGLRVGLMPMAIRWHRGLWQEEDEEEDNVVVVAYSSCRRVEDGHGM